MRTTLKTMPSETVGEGRATLSDVWPLLSTPLWKAIASHELPLPALEPVDISIRPMRSDVWPPCAVCRLNVNDCRCEDNHG